MKTKTMKTTSVPAAACRFAVGPVEIHDNGAGAKTAPFTMLARSGQPIEHPYWGRVVHDLSGMQLSKGKITVDYNHDPDQVIGYANRFNIESGNLEIGGTLIPYRENDRATEVAFKGKEGVPYEASINFGGTGVRVQHVKAGEETQVNGYAFAGPGCVVRRFPLRGVSICPYGADQWTHTEFAAGGDTVLVTEVSEEVEMPEQTAVAETVQATSELKPVVEGQADPNTKPVAEAPAAPVAPPVVEATPAPVANTLAQQSERYRKAFGETQGSVYFAAGLTYEAALETHFVSQRDEITQLKQKLGVADQIGLGAEGAASAGEKVAQKKKTPVIPDP